MTCTFCGTPLPAGALFCGECGRAVVGVPLVSATLAAAPPPSVEHRQTVDYPNSPVMPTVQNPVPPLVVPRSDGAATVVCEQCGSPMSEDDIFCGECGFVSRAASEDFGRSRDTAIINLDPPNTAVSRPRPVPVVDHLPEFVRPAEAVPPAVYSDPAIPAPEATPGPDALVTPPEPARATPPTPTPPGAPRTDVPFDDSADLEATRISRPGRAGERFVLQFSTGESFTVSGSGLIGRNPRSEPGEYFDQLVRVLDPSRSVSKVHLEFGQDAGRFWIMDRYSGNGTIVREPESEAVRCQPEKRFRIARGTRVDIGEQFFIVS
ncbi:zinc ribbon domain-containing protein [Glaciihabitans sp. INWT7]|uniref:double zinc ribbon domain-containing protein n=1 Tax=Glaciihabitans sp. INWT7 TaxID=2596912 RepID=UPI001629087F|nr:zinc ribbon domain-containing protein [Glaciihabitans sp. INWT7]